VSLLELRSVLVARTGVKAFVKSCYFVQTVPTTPQYYSNHHGSSQTVGTPQSVGIKASSFQPPHKVLVLMASLFQPCRKVLLLIVSQFQPPQKFYC